MLWSLFDFENRKTRVEHELPIVDALMKLLGDDAIVDADELYKVTTPFKCKVEQKWLMAF
jgi:hypothetical protein